MSADGRVEPVARVAQMARARMRFRTLARDVRQGYLQLFGIPDYARYVAHRTLHHPGEALLTQREFAAWAIERKYNRSGPRCC